MNVMHSYERYVFVKELFNKCDYNCETTNQTNQINQTKSSINIASEAYVYPVKNEDTIYFCIMSKDDFILI